MADGKTDSDVYEWFPPSMVPTVEPFLHTDGWKSEEEDMEDDESDWDVNECFVPFIEPFLDVDRFESEDEDEDNWDDEEEDKEEKPEQSCEKKAFTLDRASSNKPWCKHMVKGTAMDSTSIHRSLCRAASLGHLDEMKSLVSQGADVNLEDRGGDTPLLHAVRSGNLEAIEFLVNSGADVNYYSDRVMNPFLYYKSFRNSAIIEFLISRGADVNAKSDNATPLHYAAWFASVTLVDHLVKNGANVNARDFEGATPLYSAIGSVNLEKVALLLDNGADVNAKDYRDGTPIHCAVKIRNNEVYNFIKCSSVWKCHDEVRNISLETVVQLIDQGATLHAIDEKGETPGYAEVHNRNLKIRDYLSDLGVNLPPFDTWYPYSDARYRELSKIIRLLLKKGADVNATNKKGETPLDLAKNQLSKDALQEVLMTA